MRFILIIFAIFCVQKRQALPYRTENNMIDILYNKAVDGIDGEIEKSGVTSRNKLKRFIDYVDDSNETQLTDIFDIPQSHNPQLILENCSNVVCVPHFLCINDSIVSNGTDLFEWRISERIDWNNGENVLLCEDMEIPCCADDVSNNVNSIDGKEAENSSNDDPNVITSEGVTNNNENSEQNLFKCGFRNRNKNDGTTTRIINGDEAHPSEFPWMVGLFTIKSPNELLYLGGGSLIHPSVVLSAAHLVMRNIVPEQLIVHAGDYDVLATENPTRQHRNTTNIIIHEDLYARGLINDIALIVLSSPFKLTATVNTICLPPQSIQSASNIFCAASGWGKDLYESNGEYQAILRKVKLPIVDRAQCERKLRKTRLGTYYQLNHSLICAGGTF